ncbi:MAG: hypothetical protein O3A60_08140, partial [Planctomycetota bacterium]|nr:hypothetical protein [Planctomycetota bacterium]
LRGLLVGCRRELPQWTGWLPRWRRGAGAPAWPGLGEIRFSRRAAKRQQTARSETAVAVAWAAFRQSAAPGP